MIFIGKKVVLSISEHHTEKLLHFPDPLLVPPVTYDVLDRWWTSLQKLERDPNSVCAFYLDAISGSHLFCPVKKDALPAADVGILCMYCCCCSWYAIATTKTLTRGCSEKKHNAWGIFFRFCWLKSLEILDSMGQNFLNKKHIHRKIF